MKATIITIGDEILIGQIVDTNSVSIAKLNAKKSKTTANVIFSGGKVLKFRLKYCTITKSFLYLRCSGWGVGRCNTANSVRTGPKDR